LAKIGFLVFANLVKKNRQNRYGIKEIRFLAKIGFLVLASKSGEKKPAKPLWY